MVNLLNLFTLNKDYKFYKGMPRITFKSYLDDDIKENNIKKGHLYLTDLLSEQEIHALYKKMNLIRPKPYIRKIYKKKINNKQFPTIKNIDKHLEKILPFFKFNQRYLNLKPIEENIYINEIYFMLHLNNKRIETEISPYWDVNHCIFDKNYVINKLISSNYLYLDYSINIYLNSLTIPQLKNILKENVIKFNSNCKKQELINLIIENNIYLTITPTYLITEKGNRLIEKINIFLINKKIKYAIREKDLQEKEDLYFWLNEYKKDYIRGFLWGLLRNLYLSFSYLEDENSEIFLFNCFVIDISGLANDCYENPNNILISDMYKSAFKSNTKELLDKSIYDELPFNYLTKNQIIKIVSILNGDYYDI